MTRPRASVEAPLYRSAVLRDGDEAGTRFSAIRTALAALGLTVEACPELTRGYAKRMEHTEIKIERLVESLPEGAIAVLVWDPDQEVLTFWPSRIALDLDGDGDDLRPVQVFSLLTDYEPIQDPTWTPSGLSWHVPPRHRGFPTEVAYADPAAPDSFVDRGSLFKRITTTSSAEPRVRYFRRLDVL